MSETFNLVVDDQNKLVLKRPGQEDIANVRVRRAFPWSKPEAYISIRTSEGKEILLIEDMQELDPAVRELIEKTLGGTVLIPKITRVDELDVRFGNQQWKVQTDRGPIQFSIQEREDIRFLPDGRFSLRDMDGNVYELPRLQQLDAHSRNAVEPVL